MKLNMTDEAVSAMAKTFLVENSDPDTGVVTQPDIEWLIRKIQRELLMHLCNEADAALAEVIEAM